MKIVLLKEEEQMLKNRIIVLNWKDCVTHRFCLSNYDNVGRAIRMGMVLPHRQKAEKGRHECHTHFTQRVK